MHSKLQAPHASFLPLSGCAAPDASPIPTNPPKPLELGEEQDKAAEVGTQMALWAESSSLHDQSFSSQLLYASDSINRDLCFMGY